MSTAQDMAQVNLSVNITHHSIKLVPFRIFRKFGTILILIVLGV